eukprot:GHVP01066321.1.p1 GENE.GHVP01066321.1~~GHVP01066321.1.p1  ORF type:complete len:142 (-),score=27.57 GHVP01066321.1:48-452(-)
MTDTNASQIVAFATFLAHDNSLTEEEQQLRDVMKLNNEFLELRRETCKNDETIRRLGKELDNGTKPNRLRGEMLPLAVNTTRAYNTKREIYKNEKPSVDESLFSMDVSWYAAAAGTLSFTFALFYVARIFFLRD